MIHEKESVLVPALRGSAVPVFLSGRQPEFPEQSPALQHNSRVQLVSVLNAAIGERPREPKEALERVLAEIALGMDFVYFKKGANGLAASAQSNDALARFVNIARAVKREWIAPRIQAIETKWNLPPVLADTYIMSGLFIPLTSSVARPEHLELEERGLVLTQNFKLDDIGQLFHSSAFGSFADLRIFAKGLDQIATIICLLDDLSLTHANMASELMNPDSSARRFLYQMEHQVGILDLAVFSAVFHHRHKIAKPSPLTLEHQGAAVFAKEIEPEQDPKAYPLVRYRDGVLTAYRSACAEVFTKHSEEAWIVLSYYLRKILQCPSSRRARGMPFSAVRPLKGKSRKSDATPPEKTVEDEIEKKIQDDLADSRNVHERVQTLLKMSPTEFAQYTKAFPDVRSWRASIEEKEEPTFFVDLIQRFVDADAIALAARFLLLLVWDDLDFGDDCRYPVFRFLTASSRLDIEKVRAETRVSTIYKRLSEKTKVSLAVELKKLRKKALRDIVY